MQVSKCGLAYKTGGSDSSDFGIILVHGWACQHSDYDGVFKILANEKDVDYRIVSLDLSGHGETSSTILPRPTMTGFGELVLTLCRELELKRIVAVGHSMGVRVAAETWKASLSPPQTPPVTVAGIIFLDGSHYKLRPSLFAFDKGDPRSAGMSEEEKASLRREAFEKMFSPVTPPVFKDSTLAHIQQMDKVYSQEVREAMVSYDHGEMDSTVARLGREGTPVMNVQSSDIGADNQRIPMREGEKSKFMVYLEENVPQVRQVVVTGSAHFPHVDRPNVVAKVMREFVGELRYGDRARREFDCGY